MKPSIKSWLKVLFSSFLILVVTTTPASALTNAQWDMFNTNGIYYWNPSGGCISGTGGGSAGIVAGENNKAKIWNYFVTANIEGLSDNPAAIAGIMGNIQGESGFNPYALSGSGVYYGLYQTNSSAMIAAVNALGGDYWGTINAPTELNDEAIKVELDYLVDDSFMAPEKRFAMYLQEVRNVSNSADGAATAAELFEVAVERAHTDDSSKGGVLLSSEAQNLANRLGTKPYWQGVASRRNYATAIYNEFVDYDPTTTSSTPISYCYSSNGAYLGDGIPHYYQYDTRWGNLRYGSGGIYGTTGSTIKDAGCGPTSFAMMATALLGKNIFPDETANIAGLAGMYVSGKGSSHSITGVLARHYGLRYEKVTPSSCGRNDIINAINHYLQDGWMIHTSGEGSAPFTSGGHYIGITGISSSGEWYIADSGRRDGNKYYSPETVVDAGIRCGNIWAIKP